MICLDTNYLILGLVTGSREAERIMAWADEGNRFCAPSVAWYEFLCGPVDEAQVVAIRGLVSEVLPFDDDVAEEAAQLYNATGRVRRLRVDAMIAAAAIRREVPLATGNRTDFDPFTSHGLRLLD